MSDPSLEVLETAAAAYEEGLVPALFQAWTKPVADAAGVRAGQRVLDVACGTGVLARHVATHLGEDGSVVGLDLNPGMLAVAGRIAPSVEWRQGAAEALPFEDETFDAVVSQFGLMLFPQQVAALREMFRVLAPGGRLAVAVFDGLDGNPAYGAVASVFERRVGKDTGDMLRFPFSLGDRTALLSLFSAAGIDSAAAVSEEKPARFPSVRDMVLADVEGWFPLAGIVLDQDTIESVIKEAWTALAPYLTADGTVAFPVRAHIVTAAKA